MPSGRWTALVAAYISVAPTWKFHTVAFPVKNCTQASKFPVKNCTHMPKFPVKNCTHMPKFPVKNCTQASKFPVKNSQKLRIIGKKWE